MPDISLLISDERKMAARSRLAALGIDPAKKLVVLGAGSANSRAKRWPVERFAELSDRLQSEFDANVVLLGSKDDVKIAAQLVDISKRRPIDLAGETELDEAAAIISTADLMISNDMGLAHLAPAVGTPTIVLFGPTNPETTRPYSRNAEIIRKDVECSPCMYRDCPIDHRCMTRISIEEVANMAAGVLIESEEEESEEAAGGIR
jgi:heptosyltransferase-2